MTVLARDEQLDVFTSTASVIIHVTDVNDNSPVFLFPSLTNNTIHISNRLPIGSTIAKALALDDDKGSNGHVTYAVTFDGDVTTFDMDANSGSVTIKRSLKEYDYQIFQLSILATDEGFPQKSTSALLNIIVNRTIPLNAAALSATGSNLISFNGPFLYILLAVLTGCAVVVMAMLVAMVIVKQKESRRRNTAKNSRMQDALKSLVTKDTSGVETRIEKNHENGHCKVDSTTEALDEVRCVQSTVILFSTYSV